MSNATDQHPGIYAFMGDDDGIISITVDGQQYPMVCLGESETLLPRLCEAAQAAATQSGKTVRLLYFSKPEELRAFQP